MNNLDLIESFVGSRNMSQHGALYSQLMQQYNLTASELIGQSMELLAVLSSQHDISSGQNLVESMLITIAKHRQIQHRAFAVLSAVESVTEEAELLIESIRRDK